MAYDNLLFEVKDQIARLTLNRPQVLNALNRKTLDELDDCLKAVRSDNAIRVLIVTGAGEKAFIAGADINELSQHTPVSGQEFTVHGQEIIHRFETLGKPSIAAINGFALGGGCELALACTMRIASRNAKLGQPEVKLGIIPGLGGSQRLPRLCGKGVAHRARESRGGAGGPAGDGGNDREENHRKRAVGGAVRDGSGGAGNGDAARRGLVPGGDVVRIVLHDARYARRHARIH